MSSRSKPLMTTDTLSGALKMLNRNVSNSWKNSSTKFNKTITTKNLTQKSHLPKNLMTQQDLDKLFERSKSKQNNKNRSKNRTQTTNMPTQQIVALNGIQKNLVDSVKFLKLDDPFDKFLTGLSQNYHENQYRKVQQLFKNQNNFDNNQNIDLTLNFKQNYLVGKIIGQGAYASVRVAIYKPTNKKIAIKVYEKNKIKETPKKKSVRRQIKILQNLTHPNILKILDVVQTNNHLNIIMEYLPGISLNSFIKSQQNNRIPEKTCKKIIKSLAEALKYMHNKNIAHRDIKLQNIILDEQLSPKLIDFGFSTCLQPHQKVKIFCGTPSYMAPQIVQKRQYKGQPSDIWALGVLFFVCLTGIFPFKGATDQQLYKKINSCDYPRTQIISFSKQITDLIHKMLNINPDERITASQILHHPWIHQKTNGFKKLKKVQNTIISNLQSYRNKAISTNKSKQKQFNNTRKFTETCKQNLKIQLKLIKRTSQTKKFTRTQTQRNLAKQLSKCKVSEKPSKQLQKNDKQLNKQKYDRQVYKQKDKTGVGSSLQNKQNNLNNLSLTNRKVLDLLRNQINNKKSNSKIKQKIKKVI